MLYLQFLIIFRRKKATGTVSRQKTVEKRKSAHTAISRTLRGPFGRSPTKCGFTDKTKAS